MSFSDTICRSCADRVRIEGLWATSPPAPVWPGSPHAALLFVGLPLVTALVLLASPLDDVAPPPQHEARAPVGAYLTTREVPSGEIAAAAMPNPVAAGASVRRDGLPAVIYETRGGTRPVRAQASDVGRKPTPGVMPGRPSGRSSRAPERITLAAATATADSRLPASSLAPQSP